ncbi:MAG: ABC-2 family transporter protein [Candidatus Marsarchaeota archaeon]|nr:ABC-2 family transporter protein [Candidatus Marsarchaeota archaeon]MCL5094809.1 ABC-2 family transporter protein [Candidatus Marsarchaeota archaeon]
MLDGAINNIKMVLSTQKMMWKSNMIYRSQFIAWMLVFLLMNLISLITITIVYSMSKGIAGWDYYQMLLISSLANTMTGIFLYIIWPPAVGHSMRNGEFDQFIVKPYNPFISIISNYGIIEGISMGIGGVLIFAYAAYMTHISIITILLVLSVSLLGLSSLIMFLIMISLASYVLFKGSGYISSLINISDSASRYPITIYGLPGMLLFTFVMPVGLASYYPAAFIFGKISIFAMMLLMLFEIATIVIYYKICKWLITKYESGGG